MTKHINVLFILLAFGCTGQIDGLAGDGGDPGELVPPDCTVRGPRMTRRLTALQLRNTLQQAFGDPAVPAGDVVADPVVNGFKVDATQAVVRDLDAQLIMSYSETVADWAVTNKLAQLSTCQTKDAACVKQLIETLGTKLFREPVPATSVDAYAELFAAEPTFADGARVVIATMIQSPYFLYRRELGVKRGDGLYALTPYELASNLSYMLTNFPPDDQLMAAAAEGRLSTVADLDREVARLLAKPESEAAFGNFTRNWLEIDDLLTRAKIDPTNQLSAQIRTAMLEETTRLFMHVLRTDAKLSELFIAPYTFVDQQLAGYYGLGGAGGTERVPLPPNGRGTGLLGHGSVLARHALADVSSPVQRGVMIRKRMLCEEIPPPPPNVVANLPPPMGAVTTRQRYEGHTGAPACQSCHTKIDPVGFAFERFDAFGKRRDLDNGFPIDATGELTGMREGTIPLDGLDSLSTYLGNSAQVRECVTDYVSYFSFGLEGCSKSEITAELAAGDGSLKSVIMAIVHSPHFTTRTNAE